MFTDCPACRRQFLIRAHHLSAAGGEVRCGFCGRQFNALQRLRDAPLRHPYYDPVAAEAQAEVDAEPQFEIPPSGAESTGVARSGALRDLSLPPPLVPDVTEAPGRGGGLLWAYLVLMLLGVALLQGAWFHRDVLVQRFPGLRNPLERLCEHLECRVIRHRDLSGVSLINRDVRLHPRYEASLLVNATMANEAARVQPYPRVQLVLFDTNGGPIAYRAFEPAEYLDASIDIERGMAPRSPVHFVLEVTGAPESAVSFEFGFL